MNQHLVIVKLILLYYLQQVFQSSDLYSTGKRAINPLGQILEIKQTALLKLPEQLACADDDWFDILDFGVDSKQLDPGTDREALLDHVAEGSLCQVVPATLLC
jgi:hypothetical protein